MLSRGLNNFPNSGQMEFATQWAVTSASGPSHFEVESGSFGSIQIPFWGF